MIVMPRTPQENERIRQLAKKNILEAGMKLFINKGYHATSISNIAKEAGISKGVFYNYFKGKEEILATMVEARVGDILDVVDQAKDIESPGEQLKAYS